MQKQVTGINNSLFAGNGEVTDYSTAIRALRSYLQRPWGILPESSNVMQPQEANDNVGFFFA